MADLGFDGKVAIITGAGGGLGREHALLLAQRGALVVVNDLGGAVDGDRRRATARPSSVVEEIKAAGGEAVADTQLASATPEGGEAIVQTAIDAFGRVDIVINNAGILRDKTFHNMTPDLLDPVLDVHLKGAFYVTQPAWINMREQGYGRIVNTVVDRPASSATSARPTTARPRWASSASPACSPSRARKTTSRPTPSRPIARTRMTEELLGALADKLDPELVSPGRRLAGARGLPGDAARSTRSAAAASPASSSA